MHIWGYVGDLQKEFGGWNPHNDDVDERRRHVSHDSYLDIVSHWRAIIRGLFRHNTSGRDRNCDPDQYCVIALSGNDGANGAVEGNPNSGTRLVILNWGDIHFDPCLLV